MAHAEESPERAAPRRPNIALEMRRVLAAVDAVCALEPALRRRSALDLATAALSDAAAGVTDHVHIPEPAPVVARALSSLVPPTRRARARAAALAAAESAPDPLHAPGTTPTLETVVAEVVEAGLDAEALCWALIRLESTHHTRLIWLQANRIARSQAHLDAADLLGWGWQGLRLALRGYDPSLRYAFSTYACSRINGAIRDGLRRDGPVPKRLTTYVRRVTAAEDLLTQRLGRTPTLDEVAAHLDDSLDQLALAARCAPVASLDTRLEADPHEDPAWTGYAVTDPAERAVGSAWLDALAGALDQLPADEAEAVRLLVVEEIPVRDAVERTGATARQLRQRAQRGRRRLADLLEEWRPADSDAAPALVA